MIRTKVFNPLIKLFYDLELNIDNRYDDYDETEYQGKLLKFEHILRKEKYKRIGSGVNVTAWGNGQWVLKFAFYGCRTDNYDLRKLHPKLRKFFVKPVYHDDFVIVQPQVTVPEVEKAEEIVERFNKLTKRDVWINYDVHHDNVGMLNGKPAIIDFGACC